MNKLKYLVVTSNSRCQMEATVLEHGNRLWYIATSYADAMLKLEELRGQGGVGIIVDHELTYTPDLLADKSERCGLLLALFCHNLGRPTILWHPELTKHPAEGQAVTSMQLTDNPLPVEEEHIWRDALWTAVEKLDKLT